jgi:hypothetical protein
MREISAFVWNWTYKTHCYILNHSPNCTWESSVVASCSISGHCYIVCCWSPPQVLC